MSDDSRWSDRSVRWEGARKVCISCGKAKHSDAYWKSSSSRDGLQHTCKECWYQLKENRPPKVKATQEALDV